MESDSGTDPGSEKTMVYSISKNDQFINTYDTCVGLIYFENISLNCFEFGLYLPKHSKPSGIFKVIWTSINKSLQYKVEEDNVLIYVSDVNVSLKTIIQDIYDIIYPDTNKLCQFGFFTKHKNKVLKLSSLNTPTTRDPDSENVCHTCSETDPDPGHDGSVPSYDM
ncbi:hypothetical protein [Salmon gill poxvirus]